MFNYRGQIFNIVSGFIFLPNIVRTIILKKSKFRFVISDNSFLLLYKLENRINSIKIKLIKN